MFVYINLLLILCSSGSSPAHVLQLLIHYKIYWDVIRSVCYCTVWNLKGHFTPETRNTLCFLAPVMLLIYEIVFGCELQIFGDVNHKDVCFLSYVMELDGTRLVVIKVPITTFEIMTRLLRIVHREVSVTEDYSCVRKTRLVETERSNLWWISDGPIAPCATGKLAKNGLLPVWSAVSCTTVKVSLS